MRTRGLCDQVTYSVEEVGIEREPNVIETKLETGADERDDRRDEDPTCSITTIREE